jgi:hypothetical protein
MIHYQAWQQQAIIVCDWPIFEIFSSGTIFIEDIP